MSSSFNMRSRNYPNGLTLALGLFSFAEPALAQTSHSTLTSVQEVMRDIRDRLWKRWVVMMGRQQRAVDLAGQERRANDRRTGD